MWVHPSSSPFSPEQSTLAPPAKSRLAARDYNQNSIPFRLHNDYHGLIHCTMDQTICILSPLQFHFQFMFGYELKTAAKLPKNQLRFKQAMNHIKGTS